MRPWQMHSKTISKPKGPDKAEFYKLPLAQIRPDWSPPIGLAFNSGSFYALPHSRD
jgi:hypothetical protein